MSNESKRSMHTPGPWTFSEDTARIGGADGSPVAQKVYVVADRALIAAAPDLLAALEALEASFHPDSERDHYRPHRSDEENRVRARAAIAKARGEQ